MRGMRESYREELASHSGLEPYAGDGDVAGVAFGADRSGMAVPAMIHGRDARATLELRHHHFRVPILS